jgi:hypothetical protein
MYFLPALDLLLHIIITNSAYRHQLNTQALNIKLTDLCSQLPTRRSKYSTYSFSQDIILENVIGSCHQLYTFYYNGSLPPDILYTYKNNWHRLTTTSFLLTTGIGSQPPALYLQLALDTATSFILKTGISLQPSANYLIKPSAHSH